MLWVPMAIAKISICLSILSIAFPAIFPWTFPGRIPIEYIGFPYNKTLNFHISGTPGPTATQLSMGRSGKAVAGLVNGEM